MKEAVIKAMKRKRPYSGGAFESSSKDTTLMKKVEAIQWISPLKVFPILFLKRIKQVESLVRSLITSLPLAKSES
ncbi:hypothetical protein WN943_006282 [Citrus x changshan-huyou]